MALATPYEARRPGLEVAPSAAPPTVQPAASDSAARRAAIGAVSTTVVSVMPVFLVGGLSVQISHDLHLTPATLGLAVAVYFGVTALGSFPVGLLVERYGPARAAQAAIILAADSMLAIAFTARSTPALLLMLAVAATANSLGQLASNASLSSSVPKRRHGLAFGSKQAAVPLATLLSGVAVPTVALTIGWRWAFVIGALLASVALALVPPDPPDPRTRHERRRAHLDAGLLVLGVSAALAAATATVIGTFLVASAVARGQSESAAGLTLTVGGALCVASRVTIGWLADRFRRGHLTLLAALLLVGSAGVALLGLDLPAGLVIGVSLGYGLGWSFPGLLTFAVVRLRPRTPAAATSVTQTGIYAGASAGPLAFGLMVSHAGYPTAWSMAAGGMALAACFVLLAATVTGRASGE